MSIVKVQNLEKSYKKFSLKNISFDIPEGYIMGFIGKNGAGKSTTIRCIMNFINFNGSIETFGMDNKKYTSKILQDIGYVNDDNFFYEDVKVDWMGNFMGKFYKDWDEGYFLKLLNKFEIDKRKKISELSKGSKMKFALSTAIAHRPKLLILDEPTSGLDPVARDEFLQILLDIVQNENNSIFFSSHIISDIEKVSDYVTLIDNGSIFLSEDKNTLMEKWKIVKFDSDYYTEEIARNIIGIKKGDFGFSGMTNNLENIKNFIDIDKCKVENAGIEEILLRVSKDGGLNV